MIVKPQEFLNMAILSELKNPLKTQLDLPFMLCLDFKDDYLKQELFSPIHL